MQTSASSSSSEKERIDDAIQAGCGAEAARLLQKLIDSRLDAGTASFAAARAQELAETLALPSLRIFILRSFTLEPVVPFLQARCFASGVRVEIQLSGFNTIAQDLINPQSALYQSTPDVVFLSARTPDIAPELWNPSVVESDSRAVERTLADVEGWIQQFRTRSKAPLVIHNFEAPPFPANGILDSQMINSQMAGIRRLNAGLVECARKFAGVFVLDYDGLIARHGRLAWHDEAKWQTIRLPISANHLLHLADEQMRFLRPLAGKTCKALVVDLDNTLWGGVIGEDGFDGIRLGPEYPGASFVALQQAIDHLSRRGIILAICSKNNWEDVQAVFERHPGMALRLDRFAAVRVNWQDKATNLREIAAELNIGTDALAFLDDDAVEREWVRAQLPDVTILPMPERPVDRALALLQSPVFERLALSEEDAQRGRQYAEQRHRNELQKQSASIEDFYRSLEMKIFFRPVSAENIVRIAQLTQKTNQFNLTTRRYGEAELMSKISDPAYTIFSAQVLDRFGDNGIVGAVILHWNSDEAEIDTFLLSCRVMGRTIETALLAEIVRIVKARGQRCLTGWYLPTSKNSPAAGLYPSHGFTKRREKDGGTEWTIALADTRIETPTWCHVVHEEREA